MKRRKKLWIACAALGVVTVMCAFALFYRPVPYRFMRGAEFYGLDITHEEWIYYYPSNVRPPDESVRKFRIVKVFARVIEEAELELTLERGWTRDPNHGLAAFTNGDESVYIDIDPQSTRRAPDIVWVTVVRPPTLLDRVHDWLQNR